MKFEKNNRINKLVKIPYDLLTTRRLENENKNTKNAFYDFFEWVKIMNPSFVKLFLSN